MNPPDQRLFEEDVKSAEFLIGKERGDWGLPEPEAPPECLTWPKQILWMRVAERPNGPKRFYVLLDLTGYRSAPPTGAFWDPESKAPVAAARWPKGKHGSRFAKVFRTDWRNAIAFYHPYDRLAAQTHPNWAREMSQIVWTDRHTIVDYLEEFHSLLNSGDYLGV